MVEAREAGSFREGDRGQGDLRRYDRGRRGGRALRGGGTTAEDQTTGPLRGVNSGGGARLSWRPLVQLAVTNVTLGHPWLYR